METKKFKDKQTDSVKNKIKRNKFIDAYSKGDISLGQLSNTLELTKIETMKTLSSLSIDVIDYDFEDENIHQK